mmetsp:Transcript_576/g.740  ORF Transcript_576/g.740 Transcript_576/m.740 type:complete len:466 (+) Transcript_576:701-2098(+)|eukprot:CAMPEP_0203762484 /NCGR_PEP_ID=MMETSP0098-20131031/15365_1 /ASSEMBLY_ACC=CAM_ASM_000208 /TAXON_ID=96639 /ORGANISM=" , Strain NY0313808BC1" /LENGTH=465 /DNA_ID=CAMNT_0050656915 /DNA_START=647 /DNA_END=2044 /DNA_ORIENTATION=+
MMEALLGSPLDNKKTDQSFLGQVLLCAQDPGVRSELKSWRWKTICLLSVLYSVVFGYLNHDEFLDWKSAVASVSTVSSKPVANYASQKDRHAAVLVPAAARNSRAVSLSEYDLMQDFKLESPHECSRINSRYALAQLLKFRGELKKAKPPLIMGGIGDSGTRAVAFLVTQMGVWMGKFGTTVKKDSRDSKLYINGFDTYSCDAENNLLERVVKSYVFYSKSIQGCRSADYNHSCVPELIWNSGVQWTSSLMRTLLNHTIHYTNRGRANREKYPFQLWGFKHPRSAFILPYLSYVTNKKMRVIHITRDGRDIAAGDNQKFFSSICKRYHTKESPLCEDEFENRVELWSRLNLDVLKWAKDNLRADQFLVVRIEDLVSGDRACFERISSFIRTSDDRARDVIDKTIRLFSVKDDRYAGKKYPQAERDQYTQIVKGNKWARKAFRYLGYSINNWGTVGKCDGLVFPVK